MTIIWLPNGQFFDHNIIFEILNKLLKQNIISYSEYVGMCYYKEF